MLCIKHGTRKTAYRARYDYQDLRETGPWPENRKQELGTAEQEHLRKQLKIGYNTMGNVVIGGNS